MDWRKLWSAGKLLLAAAILAGVGWQFARQLRNPALWERPLEIQWPLVLVSAGLYAVGLSCFGTFWLLLLRGTGQRPTLLSASRAYFIGHLGKYVPGKAWTLLLRATLVAAAGVSGRVAILTAAYETLTMMASGALLAALLLVLLQRDAAAVWQALGLLALAGLPILPPVFNWLSRRIAVMADRASRRIGIPVDPEPLPSIRAAWLMGGGMLCMVGWLLLGLSLQVLVAALLPASWSAAFCLHVTAAVAVATVAGFLALPAPGGLGVRELAMQQLLIPVLGELVGPAKAAAWATVIVLLLRLVWTLTEVVLAGVMWFSRGRQRLPDSPMGGAGDA